MAASIHIFNVFFIFLDFFKNLLRLQKYDLFSYLKIHFFQKPHFVFQNRNAPYNNCGNFCLFATKSLQ